MASKGFDISGLATKYNVQCADGRIIRTGAFADMDGKRVPLCYNHDHSDPNKVVGYAILHSVDDGVRADSYFNDEISGAKDIKSNLRMGVPMTYSIHANQLVQKGNEVIHGIIREVSLVLAGANPGAVIDHMALAHSDGFWSEEEAIITFPEELTHSLDDEDEESEEIEEKPEEPEEASEEPEELEDPEEASEEIEHSDDKESEVAKDADIDDVIHSMDGEQQKVLYYLVGLAKQGKKVLDSNKTIEESALKHSATSIDKKTVADVLHSMTDLQRDITYYLIGLTEDEFTKSKGGKEMAHTNIFEEQGQVSEPRSLTHADKLQILSYAEREGTFQAGLRRWAEENMSDDELSHGIDADSFVYLLPEFKLGNENGTRDVLEDDMSWVNTVVAGAHKLPFARVKTETMDIRGLRAKGYKKGNLKTDIGDAKVLHRETTPTMVYAKDSIDRQDILELKGNFEIVPFMRENMQKALKLELAIATLFGDGRDVGDDDKIKEECIRPIWKDDELYTMHVDLDVDGMAATLQGTDTQTYFGEGFVESEAMIKVVLDAMIEYKGRGNLIGFMDPWYINKLLLARDRDGHRLYKNKQELADALGFKSIERVEQIKDLEPRAEIDGQTIKQKKLVCLALNMQDYAYGNVQGGEVTHFENFDIDYNKQKYLDETYLSGAMRRVKSAIAIEVDVTDSF